MGRNSDVESRARKTVCLNSLMVPTMLTITVCIIVIMVVNLLVESSIYYLLSIIYYLLSIIYYLLSIIYYEILIQYAKYIY
ncbi:hypothetical protein XBKQ1_1870002 [Xenorhabdus bovienii str. kraussei Quebec]|uniref:Uncharacterized protein n=1 Tax=Xenorhabdus bovienii str. kraussei Quebec TaxID=1398203 RepID=A0A077PEQ4_XENBV|nr:hypothetical protein XBKQ1_1870002 [Xenorhabdus bovienii str. kraussei Quebec]